MSCNYSALLLAGLFSLPVMASSSSTWQFAGTGYQVAGAVQSPRVQVSRTLERSAPQMKALCRKGLALPLRVEYENQLMVKGLITERFSSWPLTSLRYELANIRFSDVSALSATCSARLTDTGKATNLQTTALSYAVAYYATQQYGAVKAMLPYLMQQPDISIDAAGLLTLLLSKQGPSKQASEKAQAYFHKYVDINKLTADDIKFWLAQWQQQLGDLELSATVLLQCQSAQCQQLSQQIEDLMSLQDEASAGDLSSYF